LRATVRERAPRLDRDDVMFSRALAHVIRLNRFSTRKRDFVQQIANQSAENSRDRTGLLSREERVMLRDGSFEGSGDWSTAGGEGGETVAAKRRHVQCADDSRCEQIHRRLRRIAKARGVLDLQEAEALREAEEACIWRRYGYASLLEYLERELGYTPRVALERLRVAKAIDELPMIGKAMAEGELSYSAARELTRVATAETEGEWLEASRELNLRELEERVAGHKRGDRPTDRPDPTLRRKDLRMSLKPETHALVRQAQQILGKERGERLDEDAYMAATARVVIDGHQERMAGASLADRVSGDESAEAKADGEVARNEVMPGCRTKAPYQIAVTLCRECKRGWQDGGGLTVEMSPAAIARARCDAEEIGSIEDGAEPTRAVQAIPPSVRRLVWRRDHGRCRVPGCRSSWNLDIHHIVHREDGGTNDPENLSVMCEGHHLALHEGSLVITGRAPELVFTKRASNSFTIATRVVETAKALETLGFKKTEAKAAAEQTRTHVGTADWPIQDWIRYALSRCPRGKA
jgi:hypothetical protein